MLKSAKKVCEDCIHYGFFDSGYGYCRRYPPTLVIDKITLFNKLKYKCIFPMVAWCDYACGEFKTTHKICKVKKKDEQR